MKPILDYLIKNFNQIPLGQKQLIVVILIVCSLFYVCICVGIYFSKIKYGIVNFFNNGNILKNVHFRKKFNFQSMIKFSFDYLLSSYIIWFVKIVIKANLLVDAILETIGGLYYLLLLVKEHIIQLIKSNLNCKEVFYDFEKVLLIFKDLHYTFLSLIQTVFFFNKFSSYCRIYISFLFIAFMFLGGTYWGFIWYL